MSINNLGNNKLGLVKIVINFNKYKTTKIHKFLPSIFFKENASYSPASLSKCHGCRVVSLLLFTFQLL